MNEIRDAEQQSFEYQQQYSKATDAENDLENCLITRENKTDFFNESNNLLSCSTNIDQCLSVENNDSIKHDKMCVEMITDDLIILNNKMKDVIVDEKSNNDNLIKNEAENNKCDNDNNTNSKSQEFVQLIYDWSMPTLICSAINEFKPTETNENFTKGCHWSPDGTCILVPTENFKMHIFELARELYDGKFPEDLNIPPFKSTLNVKEGGLIYDCSWFPYMSSWDLSTCCFLSTSQGSPVHLWDAFTGQLRATYRAYNQVDEVEAAISIQFTNFGGQIWAGFKNALRTFDTNYPGRQVDNIYLKKDFPNITGLVSCIRENPAMTGLIGFGTYSKYIGLYKDGPICSFKTGSGVTQIEFSPCGTKLYSSVRKGREFLCWDLRNPGSVLYSLQNRQADTNQRIYFSLSYSGEEIISGGTDGVIKIWQIPDNLQIDEELNPRYQIQMSKDCINGVSLHKNLPIVAVCTGSRIYENEGHNCRDNSLRLYWLGDR